MTINKTTADIFCHRPRLMFQVSRACLLVLGLLALPSYAVQDALRINELIDQAVQTHPLIGSATADKQATHQGVKAAKLGFLPTPAIGSQYNENTGQITSLVIRQPLWTGGKLTANVNRAISDDKAAAAKIVERQNEVAKNTIDIWQSYIYALSLQQLYLDNLKQLAEFEAMMKRRVAQGISAGIELDLVTNRILQDQNALQGAIEQERIAQARLEQLIGAPISKASGVDVASLANVAKKQSATFGDLAFGNLGNTHPTVIRHRYEIEAARQDVKAQQASRYPSIYVQYKNDYNHKKHHSDDDITIGLSYDPGAGFSNLALANASQARVQSLIQTQEASRRSVMENIQTEYQRFVSAKDQELSLVAAVAGAQIVLNSYRRQFVAGRKTWLEVLNAVREQSQYEQQLRQIQAQMVASFYKLQVDFGLMPWQKQPIESLIAPSQEYRLLPPITTQPKINVHKFHLPSPSVPPALPMAKPSEQQSPQETPTAISDTPMPSDSKQSTLIQ